MATETHSASHGAVRDPFVLDGRWVEARRYNEVRDSMVDFGMLGYLSRHWTSIPIEVFTDSAIVHCGATCWCHDHILALQMTAFGDKKPLLSKQVEKYPGRIVYFEPSFSSIVGIIAANKMLELTSLPYGWRSLFTIMLEKLNIIEPNINDDYEANYPPCCSHAMAMALDDAGLDVREGKANSRVTPADLARSRFYTPKYLLI